MMPFPWKKTKCSRISQFVADHLHQHKRGGSSLVVETGFPTSLIDLFVKNRDRMKKPSKKKRFPVHHGQPPSPLPSLAPESSRHPPSSSGMASQSANQIGRTSVVVPRDVVAEPTAVGPSCVEGVGEAAAAANRLVLAALKIFFVVILALGTKRFVVGITVSAFLLFFLEHLWKYMYRLFDPCLDTRNPFDLMVQRVLCFVSINEDNIEEREISVVKETMREISVEKEPMIEISVEKEPMRGEEEDTIISDHWGFVPRRGGEREFVASDRCNMIEDHDLNSRTAEIGIVQRKSDSTSPSVEVHKVNDNNFELANGNKRLGFGETDSRKGAMEGEEDYTEVAGLKEHRSRRAKMKSKMKKLVPKKLRHSKKTGSKSEVGGSVEEYKCEKQDQVKDEGQIELVCPDKMSMVSSASYTEEDEDVDTMSNSGESTVAAEEVKKETERRYGYWGFCMIVLIGLLGGRVLALVLTLSWCLVLKSSVSLRRYIKIPGVRSSGEIGN